MKVRFGYRAVEEQHQPDALFRHAFKAEKKGFDFIGVSDHFHPWFHEKGCAGQAWVWIAAAAARTKEITYGTCVTVPTFRYHPAVVAQTFATLDYMFPGRIFLGVGTGEAMNEVPLGFKWPNFTERAKRLEEAIRVIRRLWTGCSVTFNGNYYQMRSAKLYTPPKEVIPLYVAAEGPKSGRLAGRYGDGLITYDIRVTGFIERLFEGLKGGCLEVGRVFDDMPKMMEMKVSYHQDYDKALKSMMVWRVLGVDRGNYDVYKLSDPRELDRLAVEAPIESISEGNFVFTDLEELIKRIEVYIKLGFNEIQIGSSSPDELNFIEVFGEKALPYLREEYGA